jgi:hypothetical protein
MLSDFLGVSSPSFGFDIRDEETNIFHVCSIHTSFVCQLLPVLLALLSCNNFSILDSSDLTYAKEGGLS